MGKPIEKKDGSELLNLMLEASGGLEKWKTVDNLTIDALFNGYIVQLKTGKKLGRRFSSKEGFVFDVEAVEPDSTLNPDVYGVTPLVYINDYPEKGHRGIFASEVVKLENSNGEIYKTRKNPRSHFIGGLSGLRRLFRWDELDMLYFVGYAVYNYYLTPYIFTFEGVKTYDLGLVDVPPQVHKFAKDQDLHAHLREETRKKNQKDNWVNNGDPDLADYTIPKQLRLLEVIFPKNIPTHSPGQQFFVYPDGPQKGLIYAMKYFPEIGWLIAPNFAHFELNYRHSSGIPLVLPFLRQVYMESQTSWLWQFLFRNQKAPLAVYGDLSKITYFGKSIPPESPK